MKKDLLYCAIALQYGFINSTKLTEIQSEWALDPDESLIGRLKNEISENDFITLSNRSLYTGSSGFIKCWFFFLYRKRTKKNKMD